MATRVAVGDRKAGQQSRGVGNTKAQYYHVDRFLSMTDLNPQERQMADESMVRTLAAQAQAVWPQEVEFIRRYGLSGDIRILDAGCGTGEWSSRVAELFPQARVVGVDILEQHLVRARQRYAGLAS